MARLRKIPSTKDRMRKVKKKGGFDDAWIDKKFIKNVEKTHDCCYFCKQPMHAIDLVNKEGRIVMSCNTDNCAGNYYIDKTSWAPQHKKGIGRLVDSKVCFDLGRLLTGREPGRLWAQNNLLT